MTLGVGTAKPPAAEPATPSAARVGDVVPPGPAALTPVRGGEAAAVGDALSLASIGNSSDGDLPVYHVDGKPLAIPLKPSEVRNEVLSELRGIVNAVGLVPGSIEKLRDLQETMRRWATTSTAQPQARHSLSVLPSTRTVGAPQKLRLEAGSVKARHNGKRSKGQSLAPTARRWATPRRSAKSARTSPAET